VKSPESADLIHTVAQVSNHANPEILLLVCSQLIFSEPITVLAAVQLQVTVQEHWRCTTHCRQPSLVATSCPLQNLTSSVRWAGDSFQDYSFTFCYRFRRNSALLSIFRTLPTVYSFGPFTIQAAQVHTLSPGWPSVCPCVRTRERRYRVLDCF